MNATVDSFAAIARLAVPLLAVTAVTLGGAAISAQQPATPAPQPREEVTITGCVQKASVLPPLGVKSPSGFVLMNASTESYANGGGSGTSAPTAGTSGTAATPPGTPGVSGGIGASGKTGPINDAPRGSTLGSGLNYLLDGQGLDAHAGEYVEVRGRLTRIASQGSDAPSVAPFDYPERLVVSSMRTLAKSCPN